jgi:DDE domain
MRDIESSIARYLAATDTADRQEPAIAKVRTERLQDKIAALKEQMRSLKEIEVPLNAAPDAQVSLTDPDARSMKTRGTGVVGYNVQTAVDAKHHLIVAHVVTNDGIDRDQLTSMAKLAHTEMGVDKLTAVADRGYCKSEEILACHEAGITVFVPKTVTSSATGHGRFGKDDFIYDPQTNEYRCPAGERLIWRFSTVERGLKLSKYWSSKAIDQNGEPETITVDKSGANLAALEALNAERSTPIKVRQNKYLNNIVEQDHRAIKRIIKPMMGFKDFRCARIILAGIELMHMIRKGQMHDDGFAKTAAGQFYSLVI